MAHNIYHNPVTGKDSFFSVKEKAWHGLGQIIQDYPTSSEAIVHAGLNYTVEKRPLFTLDSENHAISSNPYADDFFDDCNPQILVPDYFANVRTDTEDVLGVVGKDYKIVQNIDAFSFFDEIVGGKSGILYETAGALGKGERIFVTAKLPDYIRVGRNDLIENYLFLTSSHDGLGSITIAFTPIRIVCNNTLKAALKESTNCIRIRHTASAGEKLKQAQHMLGISNLLTVELEAIYNRWTRVRITDPQVKRLVQMAMAPNKEVLQDLRAGKTDELSAVYTNVVDKVCEYAASSPSQQMDTTKGTLFGCYNAITGYYQNVRGFKDEESKFKSIMYGTALQKTQTAFDLCMQVARAGERILN
jgi:phage/plasmid-like protein (TIGR03299 family)